MSKRNLHSFDVDTAKKLGVEKALILKEMQNIAEYKENNDIDMSEGYAWVYYSAKGLSQKFPYFNPKSISRWMLELERDGYIISEYKSSDKRDRVKWYALQKEDNCISQNEECSISQNEECNNKDTTLSKHTTQSKENIIEDLEPPTDIASKEKINASAEDDFNWFWKKYPLKVNKQHAKFLFLKLKISDRLELKENLDSWLGYKPFDTYNYPHPTTFINKKRWQDEIPIKKEFKKSYNENDPKHQW